MAEEPTLQAMEHDEQVLDAIAVDEEAVAQRASRKREREASLEPQTPKSDYDELAAPDSRDRRTRAAKKNRLEPLTELESPPHSPPLNNDKRNSSTPPERNAAEIEPVDAQPSTAEASKVQQIRRRVKDLNCKENGAPILRRPKSIYDTTMNDAEDDEDEDALPPLDTPVQGQFHVEDTVIAGADLLSKETPGSPDAQMQPTTQPPEGTNKLHVEDVPIKDESVPTLEISDDKSLGPAVLRASTPPPSKAISIPFPNKGGPSGHQRRRSGSDISDPENLSKSPSRKRKLVTRQSTFANDSSTNHEQYSKRVKDADSEAKPVEGLEPSEPAPRPKTPPSKPTVADITTPPVSTPKATGFAAFAGVSPFANLGGNAFGGTTAEPSSPQSKGFRGFASFMAAVSPFASSSLSSSAPPHLAPLTSSKPPQPLVRAQTPEQTPATKPTPPNRSRSPSTSSLNRRKSPPPSGTRPKPGAAFGTYNNNASFGFGAVASSGFGAGASRHSPSPSLDTLARKDTLLEGELAGDSQPNTQNDTANSQASWGELLEKNVDVADDGTKDRKKMVVEEVEVTTGEENEETKYHVRAKLFQLDLSGAYKERGTGPLKINVQKEDPAQARLVMRADAVLRLILNTALFRGMVVTMGPDPKYVKLTSLEDGKPVHYAIKVGSAKSAQDLFDAIKRHIPQTADERPASTDKEA